MSRSDNNNNSNINVQFDMNNLSLYMEMMELIESADKKILMYFREYILFLIENKKYDISFEFCDFLENYDDPEKCKKPFLAMFVKGLNSTEKVIIYYLQNKLEERRNIERYRKNKLEEQFQKRY
jgi:hypothetical protein